MKYVGQKVTSLCPTDDIDDYNYDDNAYVDAHDVDADDVNADDVYADAYILKVKNWRSLFMSPKKLAEKVRKWRQKNLRQEYVNHEIYDKIAYLLKNMILVCVYLRFKQLLNRVGRK